MAKGRSRAKVEGCLRRHRRRSGHPLATLSSADRKDEMRAPALGRRSMRLEGSPQNAPSLCSAQMSSSGQETPGSLSDASPQVVEERSRKNFRRKKESAADNVESSCSWTAGKESR